MTEEQQYQQERERQRHVMPIITPVFPAENAAARVFPGSLKVMTEEFKRGCRICKRILEGKGEWKELFEKNDVWQKYSNFLEVTVVAPCRVPVREGSSESKASKKEDRDMWKEYCEGNLYQLAGLIEAFPGAYCTLVHPFQRSFAKPNESALGLKWQDVGTIRPLEGRELSNPDLAFALTRSTNFKKEDWDAVGITDLRSTDFIKAGASYFKPSECEDERPGHVWYMGMKFDVSQMCADGKSNPRLVEPLKFFKGEVIGEFQRKKEGMGLKIQSVKYIQLPDFVVNREPPDDTIHLLGKRGAGCCTHAQGQGQGSLTDVGCTRR